jgi:DNA polymerase III delta prime subunit
MAITTPRTGRKIKRPYCRKIKANGREVKANAGNSSNGQASSDNWHECWRRHCELRELKLLRERESLVTFQIDANIYEAVYTKTIKHLPGIRALTSELTLRQYCDALELFLEIEEAHSAISLRKFDMFNQRLLTNSDESRRVKRVELVVDGLADGQPSLVAGDFVVLKDRLVRSCKLLSIKEIVGNKIVLASKKFDKKDTETFLKKPVDIAFISNGLVYKYYKKGIDNSRNHGHIRDRVFEKSSSSSSFDQSAVMPAKISVEGGTSELDERLASLNEPQRQAVVGILESKCRPKPYILFGPPGTGKTHTLVEAIAQIYCRHSSAKILFCANSNTCADQTVARLKKVSVISETDIRRVSAGDKVQSKKKTGGRAAAIIPERIIVTTNVKSCCLIDCYKFDYVFLDEAGHSHEPESLLPVCCLKSDGCLVLAGDPKQLGPVIHCEQLGKYGFARSLFERLFKFKMYQRNEANDKYDSSCITKLLNCYRCDPRVLKISNKLFYENELMCMNETPKSVLRMMNLSKPLQFRHVDGKESQPENSTSWRNEQEAKHCVDLVIRLYKMGFEPDQIGIMTPYKLQAKFIHEKLEKKLDAKLLGLLEKRFELKRHSGSDDAIKEITQDLAKVDMNKKKKAGSGQLQKVKSESEPVLNVCTREDKWICKIDTADAFQGNEREVIIISTVRTPTPNKQSRFIDELRRFNVTMSRAKWLVFVFGHLHVLLGHKNWREFLKQAANKQIARWPPLSTSGDPFSSEPLFRKDGRS